jgi:hypothetical protein
VNLSGLGLRVFGGLRKRTCLSTNATRISNLNLLDKANQLIDPTNMMIKLLGKLYSRNVRQLLKNLICRSPFYGIMADETTDNGTRQRLIIYIKFLDVDADGVLFPYVEYLDLVSSLSGQAEDIMVSVFYNEEFD